jgi:hypothetical protein
MDLSLMLASRLLQSQKRQKTLAHLGQLLPADLSDAPTAPAVRTHLAPKPHSALSALPTALAAAAALPTSPFARAERLLPKSVAVPVARTAVAFAKGSARQQRTKTVSKGCKKICSCARRATTTGLSLKDLEGSFQKNMLLRAGHRLLTRKESDNNKFVLKGSGRVA